MNTAQKEIEYKYLKLPKKPKDCSEDCNELKLLLLDFRWIHSATSSIVLNLVSSLGTVDFKLTVYIMMAVSSGSGGVI